MTVACSWSLNSTSTKKVYKKAEKGKVVRAGPEPGCIVQNEQSQNSKWPKPLRMAYNFFSNYHWGLK